VKQFYLFLFIEVVNFNRTVQKYGVEQELKNKVLEKLVELRVLVNPETSSVRNSKGTPATALSEKFEHDAPPATLPRF